MKISLRGACALLICAGFAGATRAQSADSASVAALFQTGAETAAGVEQVSCDCGAIECGGGCCDTGACGDACGDMCGDACGLGGLDLGLGGGMAGRGQVFFGAEWLSLRANFSEATAFRDFNNAGFSESFEQFNFDYGDSYRLFGGYRLCECACDITFAYSNFSSGGGFSSGPAPDRDGTGGADFFAPYEVDLATGDELFGDADVSVDNFDIGMSKTIPLGCPLGGGCGDCCDPCGCGPVCPAWDITWSGGIRFANVDSRLSWANARGPGNTTALRTADSTVNFDGAGLRFGLGGRRYFGRTGAISAYVRGDISLLLGEVDHTVAGTVLPTTTISSTQVVPVTEIEAGLTAFLTQNVSLSTGYMLSAWHDLGHRAEYDYSLSGTQIQLMDDANMMTFDGFFLRAEAAF